MVQADPLELLRVLVSVVGIFVSALTPIVVAVVGYLFSRRLKAYQNERAARRDQLERRHKQRTEFTVEANFYGPKHGFYLAEFLIYVHNKGNIRHRISEIVLRLRGLERSDTPTFWDESERSDVPENERKRLAFPDKIAELNVLPNPVFIEPDVKQPITFVTRIEEEYEYVLAKAEFSYEGTDLEPHTTERLFALNPAGVP